MNTVIKVPVLLLVFNRPQKTEEVFNSIRRVQPQKLYVAIDAPREGRPDDIENCNQVKAIVQNVDWPCEAHYLIQEKNLGCSLSGFTAWKWVFEQEDSLIFVEDDGLGNESAFYFVQEMLEKYKDDERIAYVGAVNYGMKYGDASYFFSRYPAATYFMGTWKRVFEKYEYDIESHHNTVWTKSYRQNFNSLDEFICMNKRMLQYVDSIKAEKRLQTYDIQMIYLSYKYDMYSIYPNINMVSNIGLDDGANNHVDVNDPFYKQYANRERFDLKEIQHPSQFSVDTFFERDFYKLRCLHGDSRLRTTLRELQPKWVLRLRSFFRRK